MIKSEYIGSVLEDLDPDSGTLKVFCADLLPAATQGSFGAATTSATVTLQDDAGVATSSESTVANHIVAEWWGDRWTSRPPIMRVAEQVTIFHFHDADKWYWLPLGRDRHLRQTDELRLEISATAEKNSAKTDSNTYSVVVSSVGKYVHFKTSKALGEPYAYVFKIDTENGTISLTDDDGEYGNRIVIVSKDRTVHLNNGEGTAVILSGKDILQYAPRDHITRADRQIVLDSPIITLNKSQVGVVVINGAQMAINMATDIVFTAARFGVSAVSKFFGKVVAGQMRASSYAAGDLGAGYKPPTSDPGHGTATQATNVSDVDVSGDNDRRAASYEQVTAAFAATAGALKKVAAAAKTSVDTDPITSNANASNIDTIKGP